MGTQIVAVRAGLVAALADLPEFADYEVTYIPLKGSKARARCFTDNARISHSSASMRATKTFRNEEGSFELVLWVEGYGAAADPASLTTAVQEVGEAAEDFVATHANWDADALGTSGLNWLSIEGEGRFSELWTDNGLSVALIYPISYRARLT
jgi:hypothetical protein